MRRKEPPSGAGAGVPPRPLKFSRVELPPSASASATRPDDRKLFISDDRKSSFGRYYNRYVLNGRRLDLSAFADSDIPSMIHSMGWTPVACMDHPVYPRLVRLFYCNLKPDSDGDEPSVTSLVDGHLVRLTCDSLSAMLGIPNEGIRYHKTRSKAGSRGGGCDYRMLEALRVVCGKDYITTNTRPHANTLPAWNRLLHDIVTNVFLPRGSSRDRVSRMDLFVLDKILRREKVNLPYMIIHHIIDSAFCKCLPYGMLLSKIFVECNVHTSSDELCHTLKRHEVYNSYSILRMGYLSTRASQNLKEAPGKSDEEGVEKEEEAPTEVSDGEDHDEKQTTMNNETLEEVEAMLQTSGIVARQGDASTDQPKSSELQTQGDASTDHKPKISRSEDDNNVYEALNKLSTRVDAMALAIEDLKRQQEQGLANLAAKLDGLLGFLNNHFCPYPPAPAPLSFTD